MTKFIWSVAVSVAVLTATVATPATSRAQFDPIPPAPPIIIDNNTGPGVGNVLFDRWVDNRRASRTVLGFSRGPSGRIIRPQPVATLMFRAGQVLPWRRW